MNVMEIVKDSMRYPFLGIKNVLVLAIIIFVGLTSFFLNGYGYRIIKSSMVGEAEPPIFNHWVTMFTDGVKIFMVSFGYMLPVFL